MCTGESCEDNRFEIIKKAKDYLLEYTNIESRPEEMAVIDNILFRLWQCGWLKQFEKECLIVDILEDYRVKEKIIGYILKNKNFAKGYSSSKSDPHEFIFKNIDFQEDLLLNQPIDELIKIAQFIKFRKKL